MRTFVRFQNGLSILFVISFLFFVNNGCDNKSSPTEPEEEITHELIIDGYQGTLVAKNIDSLPYIDLVPGTYTVTVSGSGIKLWWKQEVAFKYLILWEGNATGHHLVRSGNPIQITVTQQPFTRIFAFLIDVNNLDSSGELNVQFSKGNENKNLHVDGKIGTLVVDIDPMPSIDLETGTYDVSISGAGIKLWWQQSEPFKYALLWEANATGHHLIRSGEPSQISLTQQPFTRVFGLVIDVNNIDSSGSLTVKFKQ